MGYHFLIFAVVQLGLAFISSAIAEAAVSVSLEQNPNSKAVKATKVMGIIFLVRL